MAGGNRLGCRLFFYTLLNLVKKLGERKNKLKMHEIQGIYITFVPSNK